MAPSKIKDIRLEVKDLQEEVNLNTIEDPKITYVSGLLKDDLNNEIVDLLHKFKGCFAWDYKDMPGLSKSLVEHCLIIKL